MACKCACLDCAIEDHCDENLCDRECSYGKIKMTEKGKMFDEVKFDRAIGLLICSCGETDCPRKKAVSDALEIEIRRNVKEALLKFRLPHGTLEQIGDDHCCHHIAKEIDEALRLLGG